MASYSSGPPSRVPGAIKLPVDHGEVAKMEIVPDGARELIQERLAAANLHQKPSGVTPEARRAFETQSHLPLSAQSHRKARGEFNDDKKVKFLSFLAKFGLKMRAAQYAGISYATALNHKNADELFKQAWEEACELFQESLENEALRRALDGWDEPVYQKGELVGTIHRYSERMMELLLKANLPNKYRENVKLDANVTGGVLIVQNPITQEEWERQYSVSAVPVKTIGTDGETLD